MLRVASYSTCLILASAAVGQAPSTDIFVVPISGDTVGAPTRVTDRDGYDNQPQFLPDGQALVYSSADEQGSTDIYRYELRSKQSSRVFATDQSEYSPTPIPGRNAISVVRDYGNQVQQLWALPLDAAQAGLEPELLLPDVNPVGYHAWATSSDLLLFVLGEPTTLQAAAVGSGVGRVLAHDPGRALAKIPGTEEMSFVDKSAADWFLEAVDLSTGEQRVLIETLPGQEDYAWSPDGSVWMGHGSRLFRWRPSDGPESTWSEVADLEAEGIFDLTRLAFSPDGGQLAIVGQRPPADLTAAYRRPAGQILGAALTDQEGWERLTYLSTVIGHRLSGSKSLEVAIDWAVEGMQNDGLSVHKQPVQVPHWVRGNETASVVAPVRRSMNILGLGNSVGTPEGGLTAPVVVVRSFEELEAKGREQVEGKIVLFAVEWEGYGKTVQFRSRGPSRAAALGAVAALTRSATARSLQTPHTGVLRYDEQHPKIPAAAVTVEDASWIRSLSERGEEVTVHLEMEAEMLGEAQSFNVIAEIPGRQRPDEVVVMGGHYDSWDVGQGVHDDGAACIAAWQALKLIDQLGLQPRRTLRVVLWTNEENGLQGGRQYRADLSDEEVANHIAAIEMDGGAERPVGFGFGLAGVDPNAGSSGSGDAVYEQALGRLRQIGKLVEAIDAGEISRGGGGADIGPLMRSGVPGLGLRTVGEHYFDWHHTRADTLDKVDINNFRRAIAILGVTGYVLADMPERLIAAEDYRSSDGER